jgi:hypothetical protein
MRGLPAAGVPVRGPREDQPCPQQDELEYELIDTGIFDDDRYFDVQVEYAKAAPGDILSGSASPTAGRSRDPASPADALVSQDLVRAG